MLRAAILIVVVACVAPQTTARDLAERMTGDDAAILEGLFHDRCLNDDVWSFVISDAPETSVSRSELPDPMLEREYGAQFEARATEKTLWPAKSPCKTFPVVSGARIRAFFALDKRIPVGWEGFAETFGARSYASISRPAYSADRLRAVITLALHSDAMCGGGRRVFELIRTINGWRILRSFDRVS